MGGIIQPSDLGHETMQNTDQRMKERILFFSLHCHGIKPGICYNSSCYSLPHDEENEV